MRLVLMLFFCSSCSWVASHPQVVDDLILDEEKAVSDVFKDLGAT